MRTNLVSKFAIVFGVSVACAALGTGCSSADTPEDTLQAEDAVTTDGDWSGFTGGQCVHGVYQFYLHRFDIDLTGTCAQEGNVGSCENCGACMIWESAAVRPSSKLFNRYSWGSTKPQTYDIVVYPPLSGTGPGHVAAVDHLASSNDSDWRKLYVMDSNYVGYEEKAPKVHTVSRAPYGFYRLKSLDHGYATSPSGEFAFSSRGKVADYDCVNIDEPADHSAIFSDDYFCSKSNLGMKWSHAGEISGMDCTRTAEPKETGGTWSDNYICLPKSSKYTFTWSDSGKIAGQDCTNWNETTATSFGDNYLCATH